MDVSEPVCVAAAVAVGDDEHQLARAPRGSKTEVNPNPLHY
jgi:hypothetical protein